MRTVSDNTSRVAAAWQGVSAGLHGQPKCKPWFTSATNHRDVLPPSHPHSSLLLPIRIRPACIVPLRTMSWTESSISWTLERSREERQSDLEYLARRQKQREYEAEIKASETEHGIELELSKNMRLQGVATGDAKKGANLFKVCRIKSYTCHRTDAMIDTMRSMPHCRRV
jgi:hypothetical protein